MLDWFPGQHAGATLIVVPATELEAVRAVPEVWVRDPPADAADQVAAAGFRIVRTVGFADVVDVSGFRALRWSYAIFVAQGALGAVVVIVAQLLVLDARRRRRRSAYVLGRPMGLGRRHEAVAVLTEVGIPVVTGGIVGTLLGLGIVAVSVRRLDTLRDLPPPARVVVDVGTLVAAAGGVVVLVLVLAAIGTWSATHVRAMDAMRARD